MLCMLASVVLNMGLPASAHARSYECPQVNVVAQAQTDGSLHVAEQRTFDFDGEFSAVWWTFSGLPWNAEVTVSSMRMAFVDEEGNVTGDWTTLPEVSFQLSWRDEGGPSSDAWSFDKAKNTVYAFFNQEDARVIFELDYTVENGVQAYDDVAELYWKYVPEGWEADSQNVSVVIELPVALDAAVTPGENVRAWGHGPADGMVTVDEDGTVSYQVPLVRSGQYAEARVVFPVSWLTNLDAQARLANQGTTRLDSILAEEQAWTDQANNQRMVALRLNIGLVVGCALVLAIGIVLFLRLGREHKPDYVGDYWRDVPAPNLHPAVVGRLWRWNHESADDFTATIMHLANRGIVRIDKGSYEGRKGEQVDDYFLTLVGDPAAVGASPIDQAALRFLFEDVADGQKSLWVGSIREYGTRCPQKYVDAVKGWQGVLSAETDKHDFFEPKSKTAQKVVLVVAAVLAIGGLLAAAATRNLLVLACTLPTALALGVIANYMPRRSVEGNNIVARAKALRNWLRDFSSADECLPTDANTWGELMVYAYLFGVAKRAAGELRTVLSEVTDSPAEPTSFGSLYVPWYAWYVAVGHDAGGSSMPSVGDALSASIASTYSGAQSAISAINGSSSSAGGFGGGFSGGGGGGFGGGGGAR